MKKINKVRTKPIYLSKEINKNLLNFIVRFLEIAVNYIV